MFSFFLLVVGLMQKKKKKKADELMIFFFVGVEEESSGSDVTTLLLLRRSNTFDLSISMPLLAARATSRPAASSSASPCRSVLLSQPQKPLRARIAPRMPASTSPNRIVVRATSTPTTLLDKIRSFFNPEAAVAAPPAPPAVVRPPPVSPETVPSWSELEAAALSAADIGDYSVRPGAVPASYRAKVLDVSPTDATEPPPPSAAPVLFFSDTNSWCPFAQRVSFYLKLRGDLPHEIALIDLRNKPP